MQRRILPARIIVGAQLGHQHAADHLQVGLIFVGVQILVSHAEVVCRLGIPLTGHQVVATDQPSFVGLRQIGGQEVIVVLLCLVFLPTLFCNHGVRHIDIGTVQV